MPADPAALIALAKRVAREAPSRELDAAIHRAVTPGLEDALVIDGGRLIGGNDDQPTPAPRYTSSIDAAVTLAPPGADCHGYDASPRDVTAYWHRSNTPWEVAATHRTSPAAALAAAALRGRAERG